MPLVAYLAMKGRVAVERHFALVMVPSTRTYLMEFCLSFQFYC